MLGFFYYSRRSPFTEVILYKYIYAQARTVSAAHVVAARGQQRRRAAVVQAHGARHQHAPAHAQRHLHAADKRTRRSLTDWLAECGPAVYICAGVPEGGARGARAPDEVHLERVLVDGSAELLPQRHALRRAHRAHQLPVLADTSINKYRKICI